MLEINESGQIVVGMRKSNLNIHFKKVSYRQKYVLHKFGLIKLSKHKLSGHVLGCSLYQTDVKNITKSVRSPNLCGTPQITSTRPEYSEFADEKQPRTFYT